MFLLAQEKSDTIEFLKSELVQLLSNMRQEIAASRQSQTGAACHHIVYCMDKIQGKKFRSHCPPHRILKSRNHDDVAPATHRLATRGSKKLGPD